MGIANDLQGRLAVYDAPNKPFEIRLFPVRAPRADEVLVKIRMSTICRSDIHSYLGHRPNPCPGVLGHEIIGTDEICAGSLGVAFRQSWWCRSVSCPITWRWSSIWTRRRQPPPRNAAWPSRGPPPPAIIQHS